MQAKSEKESRIGKKKSYEIRRTIMYFVSAFRTQAVQRPCRLVSPVIAWCPWSKLSKSANSSGLQPFAARRGIEVEAYILAEADHDTGSREAAVGPDRRDPGIVSASSMCEIVGARNVWNWTRSLVKRRSSVQSKATRSFFSKRGSLLR